MGQQFSSHQDEGYSNTSKFINALTQQQRSRTQTKLPPPRDHKKTSPVNKQAQQELIDHFQKIASIYKQEINKNDFLALNKHVAEIERVLNQGNLSLPLNLTRREQQALEEVMSTLIMNKPQHIKAIVLLNKLGITFEIMNEMSGGYQSIYYTFCRHYNEQYNVAPPWTKEHYSSLLNNILSSLTINEQITLLDNGLESDQNKNQEWSNLGHGIRWKLPILMIIYNADVSRVPEELLQGLEDNYLTDLAKFIRTVKEMEPNKRNGFLADLKLQLLETSKNIREIPQASPKQYITFFACLKDKSTTEKAPLQRALYRNLNKVMKHHFHEELRHDEATMMMNLFFNCENHDLITNAIQSAMNQLSQSPNIRNN